MMRLVVMLSLFACAPAPVPKSALGPPKPHDVTYEGQQLSCPKTSTSLSLDGAWAVEGDGQVKLLRKTSCRALLIVRAGLLVDRDASFDQDWAAARAHVKELPEDAHTSMREHAAEIGVAHTRANGVSFRYELDQLANLSCSFLIVGDLACVGEPLQQLLRAPGALRLPPAKEKERPTQNMGPSESSRIHMPGGY